MNPYESRDLTEMDRRFAERAGFPDAEVSDLWDEHLVYCDKNGRRCGGEGWRKFINSCVETRNRRDDEAKALDAQAAERERLKVADKARRKAEDEAYAKQAVSFGDYLNSLTHKPNPTDAEKLLLLAGSPRPGEAPAAFMTRVFEPKERARLIAQGERDGLDVPGSDRRVHRCPCGAPAMGWGNRPAYRSGRCEMCKAREAQRRMGQ